MTRRERQALLFGVLAGLVPALLILVLMRQPPLLEPGPREPQVRTPELDLTNDEDAVVQLTDAEQERIGLQTSVIRRDSLFREVVAPARVEELAITIHIIEARASGRIDRLFVSSVGQLVEKGQPVAFIYGPELAAAAEEYRSVVKKQQLSAGPVDAVVAATRQRLESWGLDSNQIQDIVVSPEKPVHGTLYAGVAGIVRTQNVTEGRYVSAGEVLMTLIDLTTVSLRSDIFESDIDRIRSGLQADITSDAIPGVKLSGTVNSVEPRSDLQSGTTPVHIRAQNPGMRLKPGMFVRAVLKVPAGSKVLTVPRTAVIDTGMGTNVYLAFEGGLFRRQSIHVGPPGREGYPVIRGLVEGDRVVTHGAFLIDSQTRLTAGTAGLLSNSKSLGDAVEAGYKLTFRITPDPPLKGRGNNVKVTVVDPSGTRVGDAQVRVSLTMPAMPSMGMPEMHDATDLRWTGSEYDGFVKVAMVGPWNVVVEARRGSHLLAKYSSRFNAR